MNRAQWIRGKVPRKFTWSPAKDVEWGSECKPSPGWRMVTTNDHGFKWKGYIEFTDSNNVTAALKGWSNYSDTSLLKKDMQRWFIEKI